MRRIISDPSQSFSGLRRTQNEWPFSDPATRRNAPIAIAGNFQANNGETVRRLAVDGLGIARLSMFHVDRDIEAGRLVPILERFNPGDLQMIQAVFVGHEHLAARIRAFVDFLAANIPRTELDKQARSAGTEQFGIV